MRLAFATRALLAVLAVPGALAVAQSDPRVGCYRADRPLGTAASAEGVRGPISELIGEAGPGLRTLATFRLLEAGGVDRPGTVGRKWWVRGSRWAIAHDTLNIILSTRTSGWDLRLLAAKEGGDSLYEGKAQYLTDVIVRDTAANSWRPSRVAVRVRQARALRNRALS